MSPHPAANQNRGRTAMGGEQQTNEPETGQPEAMPVPQQSNNHVPQQSNNHVPQQADERSAVEADVKADVKADVEADVEADAAGRTARILILEGEPWDGKLAQRLLLEARLHLVA